MLQDDPEENSAGKSSYLNEEQFQFLQQSLLKINKTISVHAEILDQ
jgi:hypothetical protein